MLGAEEGSRHQQGSLRHLEKCMDEMEPEPYPSRAHRCHGKRSCPDAIALPLAGQRVVKSKRTFVTGSAIQALASMPCANDGSILILQTLAAATGYAPQSPHGGLVDGINRMAQPSFKWTHGLVSFQTCQQVSLISHDVITLKRPRQHVLVRNRMFTQLRPALRAPASACMHRL